MSRLLSFILFFAVASGIVWAAHYYIWLRLARDPQLPQPWRLLAALLLALLALSIPAALLFGHYTRGRLATALVWPAYVWMGMMFLLLVSLFGSDLVRWTVLLIEWLLKAPVAANGLFARRLVALVCLGLTGVASGFAAHAALSPPTLRRLQVALPRLPASMTGTKIVQLSDLHLGPTLGRSFLRDIVQRTNELQPDLVVITGDLVDGGVGHLNHTVAELKALRPRFGVFFVTGNHEYYAGVEDWLAALPTLGVRVLSNERVSVGDGQSLDLAGINDPAGRGTPHGGPDLERALAGRDPSRALVLLAHQPKAIHEAQRHGVGLQLSGHTHDGQIWPFRYLVGLTQPFMADLGREGGTQIYVSRGTGFWGPPMRLFAPPEITLLELVTEAGVAGSPEEDFTQE